MKTGLEEGVVSGIIISEMNQVIFNPLVLYIDTLYIYMNI